MNQVVAVKIPHETVNDDYVLVMDWQVTDGAAVSNGQVLVEVETSKSVIEITSPSDGVVRLLATSGTEVPIGDVLCLIGADLAAIDAHQTGQQVLRAAVDDVSSELPRAAIPPSKSTTDFQSVAPIDGLEVRRTSTPATTTTTAIAPQSTRFSQAALRLLKHHGLAESDFASCGLIRERDIVHRAGLKTRQDIPVRPVGELKTGIESPATMPTARNPAALGVPYRSEPLPRSKRVEARVLNWSQTVALRSSVTVQVLTCGRERLAEQAIDALDRRLAATLLACGQLLREFPTLNACGFDDEIRFYEHVHLGYALDAGRGLKVPIFRDIDQSSVERILSQRDQYVADYLADRLALESLSGGTFTVSDLSGSGVTRFEPLISEGQSAILGIGAEYPCGNGRAYELILSFDHRLSEGRLAARFLNALKMRLEDWEQDFFQSVGCDSIATKRRSPVGCDSIATPQQPLAQPTHDSDQKSPSPSAPQCRVAEQLAHNNQHNRKHDSEHDRQQARPAAFLSSPVQRASFLIFDLLGGLVYFTLPGVVSMALIAPALSELLRATDWSSPSSGLCWVLALPAIYTIWLVAFLGTCTIDVQLRGKFAGLKKPARLSSRDNPIKFMHVLALYLSARMVRSLPMTDLFLAMRGLRALALLSYSPGMKVGPDSMVLGYVFDPDLTEIGDGAIIGAGVSVVAHSLIVMPDGERVLVTAPISIGRCAVLGGDSHIDPGVRIGANALIEPLSYVTAFTQIGDGEVWSGNPAKFVRHRFDTPSELPDSTDSNGSPTPSVFGDIEPLDLAIREAVAAALRRPIESINAETSTSNCPAWDSLAQLGLGLELERRFGLRLSQAEIFRLRSVRAVRDLVHRARKL